MCNDPLSMMVKLYTFSCLLFHSLSLDFRFLFLPVFGRAQSMRASEHRDKEKKVVASRSRKHARLFNSITFDHETWSKRKWTRLNLHSSSLEFHLFTKNFIAIRNHFSSFSLMLSHTLNRVRVSDCYWSLLNTFSSLVTSSSSIHSNHQTQPLKCLYVIIIIDKISWWQLALVAVGRF